MAFEEYFEEPVQSKDTFVQLIDLGIRCLLVVLTSYILLLYFSRFITYLLVKLINIYTWPKLNILINIDNIAICPLSGTIIFKKLSYISTNQSIYIERGYITILWSFIKKPKSQNEQQNFLSKEKDDEKPSRIRVYAEGLEYFVYNNMMVYNDLENILKSEPNGSVSVNMPNLGEYILPKNTNKDRIFRSMLPVYVEVNKGAVHIGSRDLQSMLVVDFTGMTVLFTTDNASTDYDYYMTVLNVELIKPIVNIRANSDHIKYRKNDINNFKESNRNSIFEKLKYIFTFKFLSKNEKKKIIESQENNIEKTTWTGLARYQNNYKGDENKDEKNEYASVPTLLTADNLVLTMYTDVPGPVPPTTSEYYEDSQKKLPEWRIDIKLFNTQANYGPWADRNRILLQFFFYPQSYRDMKMVKPPVSGQLRMAPELRLFIAFEDNSTFRVPTRDPSRDNIWKNQNENLSKMTKKDKRNEKNSRPYAWLNVNFNEGSHIYYELPTFIDENGYEGKLDVNLLNVQVTTSIDYATFLYGSQLRINAKIPAPLEWNKERTMPFDIQLSETKIYLIKDHIQLITDLIADWGDMDPVENEYFVPQIFDINISFKEFSVLLCINECNIIDQLNDKEQNSYLILSGDCLDAKVILPFTIYNPIYTTIPFKVSNKNSPLSLEISLPKSHTIGANINKESTMLGTVNTFELDGDFSFHPVYNPEYIDSMNLRIKGSGVSFKIFGYLIKYFIFMADNYFGDYASFTTVAEYREKLSKKKNDNQLNVDPINALDMNILIQGENIEVYLPESLYTYKDYITVKTKLLDVEVRGTDQFQDLQISTNPIIIFNKNCSSDFLYVDDLAIYGHRMFGPMPTKLPYGADWRFNIGSLLGEVHPSYIISFVNFLETFLYHFDDFDNAILEPAILNDFMSLQVTINKIDLSIWGKGSTTILYLKNGFKLQMDNTINVHYCNRIFLDFPYIGVYLLALAENDKEIESAYPWIEVASIDTNLSLCVYLKTSDWKELYNKQTSFIKTQDRLTKRMTFIYENIENNDNDENNTNEEENDKIFGFVPVLVPTFRVSKEKYKETNTNKQNFELLPIFIQIPFSESITGSLDSYGNKNENESNEYYEFSGDEGNDNILFKPKESELDDDITVEDDLRKFHSTYMYNDECKKRPIPYRNYLNSYQLLVDSTPLYTSEINSDTIPPLNKFYDIKNVSINRIKDEKYKIDEDYLPFQSILQKEKFKKNISYFDSSENKDKEDSIFVTIDFPKALSIILSPICIKIVQEFFEALDIDKLPDESFLDEFQIKYVNKLLAKKDEILSSIGLLVNLPSLYIQFIQDVTFPEGKTFLTENNISKSNNSLSFNELLIEDLYLNFFISQKINVNNNPLITELSELKISAEFSKIQDIFRFINEYDNTSINGILIPDNEIKMDPNNYNNNSITLINNPSFFYLSINNFDLELYYNLKNPLTQSSVIFNLGSFNVSIINQTLELLVASLFRWINFSKNLISIIDNYNINNKRLQKVITTVVKESKRLNILSNPTFLTQPSPMWRLGTSPHKSDPGWKLLFHLRYAMKELQNNHEDILKTLIPINDSNTLYNITMKNLLDWYNWENVSEKCDLINLIFNKKTKDDNIIEQSKDITNYIPANMRICLQIGKIQLQVYDNKIEKNLISVTPIQMDLIVKPKEIIHDSNQIINELNKYYYNILYYGGIGRINIVLNSNLFILAKHSLRAIGWLSDPEEKPKVKQPNNTSTIKESIKNLSSNRKNQNKSMNIFHGLFTIKAISLKISASTLELKFKLNNSSLSTYNMMFNDTNINHIRTIESLNLHYEEINNELTQPDTLKKTIIEHNTIFKVSSLSTNLLEKNLYNNGKQIKNELAEITFNNFNIHFGLNKLIIEHFKTNVFDSTNKISLLLTLGSLNINVLKSIILLYSCFEKWCDEYLDKYKYLIDEMMNEISSDKEESHDDLLRVTDNEMKEDTYNLLDDVDMSLFDDLGISVKFIFNSINIRMDLFASAGLMIDFPNFYIEMSKGDNKNSTNSTMYLYSLNISSPKIKLKLSKNSYIESDESNFISELPQFNISGMVITDTNKKNLGLNIKSNIVLNKYHCKITSSIIKAFFLLPYLVTDELEQIKNIYDKYSVYQTTEVLEKKVPVVIEEKKKEEPKKDIFELYDIKVCVQFFLQDFEVSVNSETENISFDILGIQGKIRINDFGNNEIEKANHINKNKILGELSSKNICLSFNSISNFTNQINNRLAYLVIDLSLDNKFITDDENNVKQSFNIKIQDIHSVLHIISIEKFLKFLISYKTEIKGVQSAYTQKKTEQMKYLYSSINLKKENTRELLTDNKEAEIKNSNIAKPDEPSILDNLIIDIMVSRFASIIPLTDVDSVDTAPMLKNNGKVLFSYLRLLRFNTDLLKNNSSLILSDIFFQFVESFDLNNPKHFSPLAHPVENRFVLPLCSFTLQTKKDENGEDIFFFKNFNKGIMIDFNLSLSTYIDLIVKIYYGSSKKFIAYAPLFEDSSSTDENESDDLNDKKFKEVSISNDIIQENQENQETQKLFDLSLLHKVKVEAQLEPSIVKITSIAQDYEYNDNKINVHTMNFPKVGLFLYYNKNVNKELIDCSKTDFDQIFFNINVFESENSIGPSILQFIDQFIINLKSTTDLINANKNAVVVPVKSKNKSKPKPTNNSITKDIFNMLTGHIICMNLNINESKIGLSCLPSSKVSTIVGFHNLSFTSIYALDIDQNHSLTANASFNDIFLLINNAYSPEHFFSVDLSKIIVNYTLIKDNEEINNYSNIGEFNIPLIKIGLNIRYLQDFLVFYDIWLNSKLIQNLSSEEEEENSKRKYNDIAIDNNSKKANNSLSTKNNTDMERRRSLSMEFTDYLSLADYTYSIYILANIGKIKCEYDLSQITGRGEINLNMMNLNFNKVFRQHIPRMNADFIFNSFSLTTEGKLQGFLNIENIEMNADIRNPILSLSKDNNSYSVLSLNRLGRIYSDLIYQFDKSFLLDITDLYFVTSDQYQLTDKPKLFLKNDVVLKYIKLCISKKTIGMVMSIIKKFSSFIKEKKLTSSSSNDMSKNNGKKKKNNKPEKPIEQIKKIAYDYIFDQSSKIFCSLYGVFSITLEKALIVAFRYDFKDPDSVKLHSNKLELDVKLNYDTQQVIKKEDIKKIFEEAVFSCEGIKVVKGSYKFVTKQNENTLEIDQWFSYLEESPSKNILNIPKSIIQLNGNKFIKNKLVEYVFESSFSEPIDVALNFGLYIYLVNVIKLYLSTINNDAKEGTQSSTVENIDYSSESGSNNIDDDKKKLKEYKKQINEEINIMSKKHQELFKSNQEETEVFTFKATKPIILEPQLKVIGDATSWEWVDYIGVNKEKIPVEIYKIIINNFELIFNTLCQIYGKVSIPLENSKKK